MGLYLDPEGSFRLKSFNSATRGTKGTIKIEIDDLRDLGYFLTSLLRLQDEQKKHDAAVKREAAKKPKMLALPKPGAI